MNTNEKILVMNPSKLETFAMRLEAELRLDAAAGEWFVEDVLGSYYLHWLEVVQELGPKLVSTSCGAGIRTTDAVALDEFVKTGKKFPEYCQNCLLLAALNERVLEQAKLAA